MPRAKRPVKKTVQGNIRPILFSHLSPSLSAGYVKLKIEQIENTYQITVIKKGYLFLSAFGELKTEQNVMQVSEGENNTERK